MVRFFGFNKDAPRMKFTTGTFIQLFVGILIVLQLGNIIFGTFINVKVGSVILLTTILIGTWATFAFVKRFNQQTEISGKDIFAFMLVVSIIIVGLIYIPKLVPDIFQGSVFQVKDTINSMVNILP